MLSLTEDSTKALSCITARVKRRHCLQGSKGRVVQGQKRSRAREGIVSPTSVMAREGIAIPTSVRKHHSQECQDELPGDQLALQPSGCHSQGYLATLRGDRTNAGKQTSPLHDLPRHMEVTDNRDATPSPPSVMSRGAPPRAGYIKGPWVKWC